MKRLPQRLQASPILKKIRNIRARLGESCQTSIYEEMEQGAVIGFFAATLIALLLTSGHLSGALLVLLSSLGALSGAVMGAIIWIGSAELPVEPIRAPAPGQRRKDEGSGR